MPLQAPPLSFPVVLLHLLLLLFIFPLTSAQDWWSNDRCPMLLKQQSPSPYLTPNIIKSCMKWSRDNPSVQVKSIFFSSSFWDYSILFASATPSAVRAGNDTPCTTSGPALLHG